MIGLVLCAHGSRDPDLPRHFESLARGLQVAGPVAYGFLELAAPLLEDAVADVVARGASEVALLPVLVAPGRHLAGDLPERAAAVGARIGVTVRVLPYLGGEPEFREALGRVVARLVAK